MGKFAAGKNSYAISDRSGLRYRYRDMRREWNGLLVGKDEYEPKHPQLGPFPKVIDAEALKDARPDTNNNIPALASFPAFNLTTLRYINNPPIEGKLGTVTFGGDVT